MIGDVERPPADPAKLLSSWTEWETGETLPGRVMSDLKIGGLRDLLEHVSVDGVPSDAPVEGYDGADALATWMEWETGQTPPGAVMERLATAGVRALLDSMARAASAGT